MKTNKTLKIETMEILENLKPYKIESFEIYNCNKEEYEVIRIDNSHNWNAPISNHFSYTIYKSLNYDNVIVEFEVHGDVRCNYTKKVYLQFEDEYDFCEILEDSSKHFTITDNDNETKYHITIDVFNMYPSIIIENNGAYEDVYDYEALNLLGNIINLYEGK